jgi:hypothetical protein
MGLDISAYSRLKAVGKHVKDPALNQGEPGGLDDWCYYEDHVRAYAYDTFPASFLGIPILGTKQSYDGSTLLLGGCFQITDETRTHDFQAGSYSGYNLWRDDLRDQFNPGTDPAEPFYELLWFADNEGCIGGLAALALLADFREHADRYAPSIDPEWIQGQAMRKYQDWTRACELAADGGLIRFH